MSDINFTDRDVTEVKEHDKNKKSQEARKIRFTGKTASKIANKWINHYKKKAVQTAQELKSVVNSYDNYVDYINNNSAKESDAYISMLEEKMRRLENLKFIYERKASNSFMFFQKFGILTKKRKESKAVKLKEKMFSIMKRNGDLIFAKGKNNDAEEINVNSINQDNVKKMVDDMFKEQSNDYNNEVINVGNLGESVEFTPPAISGFQYPTEVVPPIYNQKENDNFASSVYRMKKDEIIQDDLSVPAREVKEETPSQNYNYSFDENKTEYTNGNDLNSYQDSSNYYYNREEVEIAPERDEIKEETKAPEMELNDKVDDFINKADNGGVSIEDLEQLRRALDAERNKAKELKKELEEKRIKEAEATREAERAEQAKLEKLKFVNDALNAYKEENERLINESRQLDESAQQKISKKQQAMSTIASLNEMIGPTAVNVNVRNNNTYKGK